MDNNNPFQTMLGVCTECGIAITSEEQIGARQPKLKCKSCVEKERFEEIAAEKSRRRKAETRNAYAKSRIKKSFLITGIAVIGLGAFLIAAVPSSWLGISVTMILIYTAALQVAWDVSPISDIFMFFLGGPKLAFGFIIELSIDGILWYIAVKLAFFLLGILLSIISFFIGVTLCILLGIFTFPFALFTAIKHPEQIDFLL